jgi:predicted ATP-binding protein involved in virulence
MFIKKVSFQNFRGIRELSLDLGTNRIVILAGINGSGKTSVLDGISMLMSWFTARMQSHSGVGRYPNDADIMNNEIETKIEVSIESEDEPYSWSINKARKGSPKPSRSDFEGLQKVILFLQSRLSADPGNAGIPLFVYYPVNRAVLDVPLRIRKKHAFTQLSAYEKSGTDFRTFFEWYRDQEDYENEQNRDMGTLFRQAPYTDKKLDAVRKAVNRFLPGFSDLKVQRRPLRMVLRKSFVDIHDIKNDEGLTDIIDFSRNTKSVLDLNQVPDDKKDLVDRYLKLVHLFPVLEVNQLSDGEKNLFVLVGDLARRLSLANPGLDNPLEGSGIVLIDEIELHLHPGWQRSVIPRLIETFPNCQFLFTTHSPQVLSEAKNTTVLGFEWGMEGITAHRLENIYGKECNRILEDIMGTSARPEAIRDKLHSYFELIDKGKIEEANKLRKELEETIGTDEPEFTRADALIRRKEIIGR